MENQNWSLFVRIGDDVTEHPLQPTTRVGRDRKLEVPISHPHVSRHHFTIVRQEDGWLLEHAHKPDENPAGSWVTIRTYVNGERVMTKAPLSLGDVITLKADEDRDEVFIEVKPAEKPAEPEAEAESGGSWWKPW